MQFQVIQFVDVDAVGGPSPGADGMSDKMNDKATLMNVMQKC